ncbi:hypothetical protein [Streptomyces sp. NPDC012510]|uniref:hypothetical protein n=1 Tax=Streptomyces sp. NPDC012510 TaxID=3364838 RepID=UPI0036E89AA2
MNGGSRPLPGPRPGQTASLPPVAVLTGAAREVGRSVAARPDRDGCRLVLGDIDVPRLRGTVAEPGPDHVTSSPDVARTDAARERAALAFGRRGRLDECCPRASTTPATDCSVRTTSRWRSTLLPAPPTSPS